jgi:hypothetical protein
MWIRPMMNPRNGETAQRERNRLVGEIARSVASELRPLAAYFGAYALGRSNGGHSEVWSDDQISVRKSSSIAICLSR